MIKKIILHWSAGKYTPTDFEKEHYHYLIDNLGHIHCGKYTPYDNLDCTDNKYAAHTGSGNTGAIGVCMCAMMGYKSATCCGNYPITKKQFEACMEFCAKLSKQYNIPITADTILTHYEFGQAHKNTSSYGKIDIIYLPPYPNIKKDDIGKFIRNKITWYKERI